MTAPNLSDLTTLAARRARWEAEAAREGGTHPLVRPAATRLLRRMRACALPALLGGGLSEPTPSAAARRDPATAARQL